MESCASLGSGAAGATLAAALHYFAAAQCLLQEPWPTQASLENETVFDFIVVGGGTAGAALAARLSEMRDYTVLLLEAGGDPPLESIIPGFRNAMKVSAVDWNFTTSNDNFSSQALEGGSQYQPRGKMLGGSGSINDMIYSRGFPADYDEWATQLGEAWSWPNVLQYFKKTEHLSDERFMHDPTLSHSHGFGGEIEVTGFNESTQATDRYLEAFRELGFKMIRDMTNPHEIGAGRFSHTMQAGKRASSATALLNPAAQRDNLYVLKDAFVHKILIQHKSAYGVRVHVGNRTLHFYGSKDIVVSAGTFNTAKLLLLSGVGPKGHLIDMGIDVEADLPVGDNLHDHIMVLNFLATEEGTCEAKENEHFLDIVEYLYDRRGFFKQSSDLAAYVSYNSSAPNVPDFAYYPTCMSKGQSFRQSCLNVLGFKQYICERIASASADKELLIVAVVNLKPKSRGRVRLSSRDARVPPLIFSGTFSDEEDLRHYPAAIRTAWAIANTTHFRSKNTEVIELDVAECADTRGEERLRCVARATATSAWHAVGTAAMGSVLDSQLRVRGVRGLRVVDASVMPSIIRGNTNAPVVMIAEAAAAFIKADLGARDC